MAAAAVTSIVAIVVGAVKISRSFDYDEAVTYGLFVKGGSPSRALTTQLVFNNHQMFSVIQAIAWRIGLVGETSQRLLPVMCGAAAVGLLTWWVGNRTNALSGAFAGLFLLLNPVFVAEFRTLRGYALATLAVLVAAITTERSWHDHRTRWLVVGAISMTVAMTTHAYSALPIAVVVVVTTVIGRLRVAHLIAWLLAALATFFLQLPLLDDIRENSEARGSRHTPGFGWRLVELYLGHRPAVVITVALLSAVGLWSLGCRSRRVALAVGASIGVVAAAVLLLWLVIEPYDLYPRFFVTIAPFTAALAAFGVNALPARLGVAAGALAVALLLPNVVRVLDREPTIRDAAALVDAAREDGRVVCGAFAEPLSAYTAPVRIIGQTALGERASYRGCDVFIAVGGIGREGRTVARRRFAHSVNLGGGVVVYSDTPVTALLP
jgi:hypothetical protein